MKNISKTILSIIMVMFLTGCASHYIKEVMPVETVTKKGQVITKIEPQKVGDRQNVPVGINPKNITAHIQTKSGAEVWVTKKGEVFENKQATSEGITIDKPKKSYMWLYVTIGIIAFLIGANFALKGFFGFNPVAWIGRKIFGK